MRHDQLAFATHLLPSGLRVLHQHRPLPVTGFSLVVHSGNRCDPPGKEELAHLLEHLLSSGTEGWPRRSLVELEHWLFEQKFAVSLGETRLDDVRYGGKAVNVRFEPMLRMLRDLVFLPTLDSDLEKEREIIRCERDEQADSRERETDRIRRRAVYGATRLAELNGWTEDDVLARLTLDDAREAYRLHYRLANMSLIVCGDIDEDHLRKLAEDVFPPDGRGLAPPVRLDPLHLGIPEPREYRQREKGGDATKVNLEYQWYLPPDGRLPMIIAANAVQDALYQVLREDLQITYGIAHDEERYADHRKFSLSTKVSPEHVDRARREIEAALRDEVAVAKIAPHFKDKYLLGVELMEVETGLAIEHAADALTSSGRPGSVAQAIAAAEALTVEDVTKALTGQLDPDRAFILEVEE